MDTDDDPADHAPMPLGEAIRRAIDGAHTQASLAAELGRRQNTVSRWVTGVNVPSLDELRAIEVACGRPVGFILTAAGYVERDMSTVGAISADPLLSHRDQQLLASLYSQMVSDHEKHQAESRA